MISRIGVLLPRSTEYPSIGFDILDGLRIHLRMLGMNDVSIFTENIGFGENPEATHAAAEKLVMNNDVDMLIVYATSLNAEQLYSFADSSGKPILFIDAGMEHFELPAHKGCYHLTLQGTQASSLLGEMAAKKYKKAIFAASFLDGGYRGNWFMNESAIKGGIEIGGHYVSMYREEDFSLANLEELKSKTQGDVVLASFTSYLAVFLLKHLKNASEPLKATPFYCSAFLAEEMILESTPFPGVDMTTVVPWSRTIESSQNQIFMDAVMKEKKKAASIFHLLGWEAALVVQQIRNEGEASLLNSSLNSPRGTLRFHPDTHSAYAPLYEGKITASENGNCKITLSRPIEISAEAHRINHFSKPVGDFTRWKNNFFCI